MQLFRGLLAVLALVGAVQAQGTSSTSTISSSSTASRSSTTSASAPAAATSSSAAAAPSPAPPAAPGTPAFVIVNPLTGATATAGQPVEVTWTYQSSLLPDTTTIRFQIQDLRAGPNNGVPFAQLSETYPITARRASVTLPANLPAGNFAIASVINGVYYSSPSIAVRAAGSTSAASSTVASTTTRVGTTTSGTITTSAAVLTSTTSRATTSTSGAFSNFKHFSWFYNLAVPFALIALL
ncbi:hypothetical protein HDU96_010939 [Phlyctochytrium bullatum]|nr:hypothetical protein HDU96_010939 [Phlyctochytrium bullatum]